MKKIISAILVTVLLLTMFTACSKKTQKISVYFKDAETHNLQEEKHEINSQKKMSASVLAELAVNEIIAGPQNSSNEKVISADAKLLSLVLNNGVATVNVTSHFLEKKGADRLILIFAFVNTLCSIDGIKGVVIQVDGKPLLKENTGEEWGVLTMSDMALNTEDKITVKLYFPRKDGEGLVAENRKIDSQQTLSMEKAVISELIKGPEGKNLSAAVASGTKLLSIETKDNVCYVNLSSEFKNKTSAGSAATTLSLYSIVNSLCELKNVDSVQIQVNGLTDVEFGNFVLDIPYEANTDLIK